MIFPQKWQISNNWINENFEISWNSVYFKGCRADHEPGDQPVDESSANEEYGNEGRIRNQGKIEHVFKIRARWNFFVKDFWRKTAICVDESDELGSKMPVYPVSTEFIVFGFWYQRILLV